MSDSRPTMTTNDTMDVMPSVTPETEKRGGCSSPSNCSPSRTHLDLFSGIGGFALAANAAGYQTIGFSEINPYACKILKRHWPDVPNYGDIRNVRGIRCELLTGGFPCQPYSLAGKRRGASDDRALWPEMLRVIGESKPRWVLGENVPGIINVELDRVLADLESLGYSAWPLVIPACAADAGHRRDRVWIVANAACDAGELLNGERQTIRDEPAINGSPRTTANAEMRGRNERHPHGGRNGEGTTAPEERSRPADYHRWPAEPGMGRVAHGIPNWSHRIQGLGNAIVPQVAETLIRMMARVENDHAQRTGGA